MLGGWPWCDLGLHFWRNGPNQVRKIRTRFGKSEPGSENPNLPGSDIRTRFGTCPTLRDTSPWESPNGVWLTVNDHRLVCDKSWGGGWPWCAFLEEWFGPSPNLQVRISELRFGNPNLQVRNPNLSFGSGIVEYDVKIFNHLLIWVTDDNLNVFKKTWNLILIGEVLRVSL